MRSITFVCAYYRNPGMLKAQQATWQGYAPEVRERFHVRVTDDCSPKGVARKVVEPCGIASYELWRTDVDVRWNWLFGRNLGASRAPIDCNWLALTDIDHVMPEATARRLMAGPLDEDVIYRFSRVDAPNLTPYKAHPNSWFMSRDMWAKVGGYDERFSGFYGSDADFRDRCQAASRAIVMLPEPLIRYPREVLADASTDPGRWTDGSGRAIERKTQYDGDGIARIRKERDAEVDAPRLEIVTAGGDRFIRPRTLSFPHHLEWTEAGGHVKMPGAVDEPGELEGEAAPLAELRCPICNRPTMDSAGRPTACGLGHCPNLAGI